MPYNSTYTLYQEHTIDGLTTTIISILAVLLILLNCGLFYEYFLKITYVDPFPFSLIIGH